MEANSAFIKAFPITWVLTAVVTIPLWMFAGQAWGASFLLGSVTSLMMMSVLYKSSMKVLREGETKPQKKIISNYMFRYAFYAIILVASALLDGLEVVGTVIGLFTFRIALTGLLFIEKRGDTHD
jgi:hypothetical protein